MPRIDQNLSDVKDDDMNRSGGWRSLDPGDYRMTVTASDYKHTKNGLGMVLRLDVQCVEPKYSSAKWAEFLVLEHTNPETVRIAKAKLKALAIAVNHPTPDQVSFSEDLHDTPFVASVIQEKASDPKYGDVDGFQNRISGYYPIEGQAPARPQRREEEPTPPSDDDIPF